MNYRILAGLPSPQAVSLGQHLELHGAAPHLGRADGDALLADLEAAGLRGRGGAGFPTATKIAAVAGRRRPIVVVNGAEGEPMSSKDRVLLTMVPHLVLDGATLAAQAIGARDCVIAAPADTHTALRAAIRERRSSRSSVRIKVERSAGGYVAGEETALIAHLEGRPALPRVKPPLPAERGLNGRPTLVQNAETLAHVALIARHGPQWFREGGRGGVPGTTLVTISGAVDTPGVYEVPAGMALPEMIEIAGGPLQRLRALLVGGYFGGWVEGSGQGLSFDDVSLATAGVGTGAGVVVALGGVDCPVAETANLAEWLAEESAGQCGPCVFGLAGLGEVLGRVAAGRITSGDGKRLTRWTEMVRGRGACRHPDGVARMIATAMRVFGPEIHEHARSGPCPACHRRRALHTPRGRAAVAA
ncbi:MAG: hypothetical protein QOF37_2770 [Thermoleophilaceae bacterium]|nr:hypothetical protein [Thermoleophilaceae bacterium]